MTKKLLSAVVSLSLLGQSTFAMTIQDFVKTSALSEYTTVTNSVSDGIFNYSVYTEKMNTDNGTNLPTKVQATVDVSSAVHNGVSFALSTSATSNAFDFKSTLDMAAVNSAYKSLYSKASAAISLLGGGDPTVAQLDGATVKGNFSVVATHAAGLTVDPAQFTFAQDGVSTPIFTWDNNPVVDAANNKITFNFTANSTVSAINATYDSVTDRYTALNDLTMTLSNAVASVSNQNLLVSVSLDNAYIELEEASAKFGRIDFASNTANSAVSYVTSTGGHGGLSKPGLSGTPSTPSTPITPNVSTVVDGNEISVNVSEKDGSFTLDVSSLETPVKDGFAFAGWYFDANHMTPAEGVISITEDTKLYARFVNVTPPANLISSDHVAYISGYPNGKIMPNANITREEVVSAFYRLLTDEYKATLTSKTSKFADVENGRWSEESIAAMAEGGYVIGDQNGNFNPSAPITRAEFATIAAKFAPNVVPGVNYFLDIDGHWAYNNILVASAQAWISGYEDGTFRPDNNITRAEAMAIINRMLVRYGDTNAEDVKAWSDVSAGDWYYTVVSEATTGHEHTKNEDGWNETWGTSNDVPADEVAVSGKEISVVTEEITDVIDSDETGETGDVTESDDTVAVDEATSTDETGDVDEILFSSEK